MDWVIMLNIADKIEEENDLETNLKDDTKCRMKMLEKVSKIKTALVSDTEAQMTFDDLIDEVEYEEEITRSDYES